MSEVERTDGRVLADRYRLVEVLGKGGMGTVWRAVDETLGRTVAVKELRFPGNVDEDEKRRLVTRTLREAKATARIRNTGAITVFDVVKEDDRPWIVMELIEGRSLSDAIREDGPLTPRRAAEVGLVLLDVLRAAHAEGILHRDVKPSNVLIAHADAAAPAAGGAAGTGGTGGGRVVLGDFGIAQIDGDPSVTSTGMLVGAPSYISPERARGQKPGPPADLWSLGALLYACVEGRPPYDKGSAIATLTAVMTEPVGPMRGAGPLAAVITGLLEKDPAKRLDEPAARAMLTAVANAPDRPVSPPPPPSDGARTAVLPVDPQPTPTDAPPATRRAAAEQARLRGALGAVRKAAARPGGAAGAAADRVPGPAASGTSGPDRTSGPAASRGSRTARASGTGSPAGPGAARGSGSVPGPRPAGRQRPAPEPGTPENPPPPARASITDVVPRRTLLIVVAALVIALLGTVIGVALAHSGGGHGDGDGKGGNGTKPSASSAPRGHASKGAAASSGGASGPATTSGRPAGDTAGPPPGKNPGPGGRTLPAGWHMYTDPEGFSIALPDGWRRTGDNGYGSGSKFGGPGGRELLVDYTHTPGKSALADWQHQEARLAPGWSDYHRVQLRDVVYRTYDAADWEYKYRSAGKPVHVLDRGFVTDGSHGYAIMVTTAAADWNSAGDRLARQTFFATFKPA